MRVRNSEGYMDLTPYIAIQRTTREEKNMKDTARPGEIWIVQSAQGESPALVLADDGYTATYIKLREGNMGANNVRIIYQGTMYVSPTMIQYGRSENCASYEKTITDDEYDAVRGAIADALNIVLADETDAPTLEPLEIDTSGYEEFRDKIHSLEMALAKCEGERDVYKDLFISARTN